MAKFPDWFKPEAGFTFYDGDGDKVVVIGRGRWRDVEHVGSVTMRVNGDLHSKSCYEVIFMPEGIIAAYYRKGEWHMTDLARDQEGYCDQVYWDKARPMPEAK